MTRASSIAVLSVAALALSAGLSGIRAQAPTDLSGTWTIDRARTDSAVLPSRGTTAAVLSAGGSAEELTLRQTATELTLIPGGSTAIVYRLDGNDTWYPSLEAKAIWQDGRLVITWTRKNVYLGTGKGYATYTGRDAYGRDGESLVVDRTITTPSGTQAGRVVYTRATGPSRAAAPQQAQATPTASAPPAPPPAAAPSQASARQLDSAPANWSAPRTPWGDPDISGNFTNVFEQATPLERPDELAGKVLNEVTGKELADLLVQRRDDSLERFENTGDVHAPTFWWADALEVEKGSQAWFIIDPPDGKVPPMMPGGRDRIAAQIAARRKSGRGPADSYTDRSLYDRCISRGLPGSMMPAIYGNSYRIVQGPGSVAISYEMIHETRVIPLDGRPTLGKAFQFYMGDARAHWEGDALVVETANFKPNLTFRNANADTLKLTERFQRVSPQRVRWTVTVEDPQTWAQPWTFSMPLTEDDSQAMYEYACHEGNISLANILSGARADERTGRVRDIPTAAEGEREER